MVCKQSSALHPIVGGEGRRQGGPTSTTRPSSRQSWLRSPIGTPSLRAWSNASAASSSVTTEFSSTASSDLRRTSRQPSWSPYVRCRAGMRSNASHLRPIQRCWALA